MYVIYIIEKRTDEIKKKSGLMIIEAINHDSKAIHEDC